MNVRRTRAVAKKEFLHILRDTRSLILALVLPMLMLLLFGYALSLDVDELPVLVWDQNKTPESRELVERFRASRFFKVLGEVEGYPALEQAILRSRISFAIIIPNDYSKDLLSGRKAQVQVLFDGSDSNTASISVGYTDSVLQGFAMNLRQQAVERKAGRELPRAVEPRLRVWYNSELKSKNYIVPGLIAVILMIISALLTSLTIAREWEMGTMEQILSTPLRAEELVLGKLLAFFTLGLIDAFTTVTIGVLIYEVPFRGSFVLLVGTTCVFLFGSLCWGIFLSAVARSQILAFQMGIISSFLPAFLLSGFIFSIENMPWVVQVVTHIVPARYFVTLLKGIFLKGVGVRILWQEIAFLVLYSLIIFAAATRKVGSRLA